MFFSIKQIRQFLENDNFLNNQNYIKWKSTEKVVNRFVSSVCRWYFINLIFSGVWIVSALSAWFVFNYVLWYAKYRRHTIHWNINKYEHIQGILHFLYLFILIFFINFLYPIYKVWGCLKLNIDDHKDVLLKLLRYWRFSRFKMIFKFFMFLILPFLFFYFLLWKQSIQIFIWIVFIILVLLKMSFPNLFKNFFVKLCYVLPQRWLNKQFVKFFLVTPKLKWNFERFKIIKDLIISDKFVIVVKD